MRELFGTTGKTAGNQSKTGVSDSTARPTGRLKSRVPQSRKCRGPMRRFAFYGATAVVLLSLVVIVFKVTTHRPACPSCPFCGPVISEVRISSNLATWYRCPCGQEYSGPARSDISWTQAAETWLEQAGVTPSHYPRSGTERTPSGG